MDSQLGSGRAPVPESFIFALKPVYSAYFDAQEALAADDLDGFLQAAGDLKTAIGFVSEAGLVGEPLALWRRAASKLVVSDPITDIEVARKKLQGMSEAVISLQERFGHKGAQTWHIAYCPMAFDNTGAEWLQRDQRINNPYFGASMLRCGELRREFPPLDASASEHTSEHKASEATDSQHEGHNHE